MWKIIDYKLLLKLIRIKLKLKCFSDSKTYNRIYGRIKLNLKHR